MQEKLQWTSNKTWTDARMPHCSLHLFFRPMEIISSVKNRSAAILGIAQNRHLTTTSWGAASGTDCQWHKHR